MIGSSDQNFNVLLCNLCHGAHELSARSLTMHTMFMPALNESMARNSVKVKYGVADVQFNGLPALYEQCCTVSHTGFAHSTQDITLPLDTNVVQFQNGLSIERCAIGGTQCSQLFAFTFQDLEHVLHREAPNQGNSQLRSPQ